MAKKTAIPAMESYVAHASVKKNASAALVQSAYKIEVRFVQGLNAAQKDAFKTAADRWSKVIIGDLPSVMVNGEVIDDLLIMAQGVPIDGPGRILGQAALGFISKAGNPLSRLTNCGTGGHGLRRRYECG